MRCILPTKRISCNFPRDIARKQSTFQKIQPQPGTKHFPPPPPKKKKKEEVEKGLWAVTPIVIGEFYLKSKLTCV